MEVRCGLYDYSIQYISLVIFLKFKVSRNIDCYYTAIKKKSKKAFFNLAAHGL